MQIIGAENFANIPTSCSSNGPTMQSLADLGANGILGVGNFKQDCGPACAAESNLGIYFTCPSSGCQEITQPIAEQLQNPVSLFATDNNGVIIELPSVGAGGAVSVNGELIFGIGTESKIALVKIDPKDNIWVTDKGSDMVIKFNPEGRVVMVFGRKQEASDEGTGPLKHAHPPLPPVDGMFRQVTDVAWDAAGDTFISDGYINSRVAKVDKDGNWRRNGPI